MTDAWSPPRPPSERSYWAAPNLIGGVYPGDADAGVAADKVAALVQAGVTLFIDLTDDKHPLAPYAPLLLDSAGATRLSLPVRDLTPPAPEVINAALRAIDDELGVGGTVYVHCWGGKGRTGTILGCYLARNLGGSEALRTLNARRDAQVTHPRDVGIRIPETSAQRAVVTGWATDDGR